MKKITFFVTLFLLTQMSFGQIEKKFEGVWFSNKTDLSEGSTTQGYLEINKRTAIFLVLSNQLNLAFNLKQKGDTLLMFYENNGSDWGRLMEAIKTPSSPKDKSLFARAVIKSNNELNVFYSNKGFVNAVNTYMMKDRISWSSNVPPFPKIFYFSNSKPIFNDMDKTKQSTTGLFNGTKKFCDGVDAWYYLVTLNQNNITLKSFADKKNNYHKNKTSPTEVIKGIIKDGKIITKDASEYLTNRFRFENGILMEINNEGGSNPYTECK